MSELLHMLGDLVGDVFELISLGLQLVGGLIILAGVVAILLAIAQAAREGVRKR
jgi:hypothetical protein